MFLGVKAINLPDLNARLAKVCFKCDFLSGVDIRIMSFGERLFQNAELAGGESGANSPLLSLLALLLGVQRALRNADRSHRIG